MNTEETTTIDPKLAALIAVEGDSPEDYSEESYDHYGLTVFSMGRMEWAIGTDEECDEACKAYIRETLWAFNPEFLEDYMPEGVDAETIKLLQAKCEDANPAILKLVGNRFDELADDAIGCDGRGHFLAGYDGHEIELPNGLYAYRTN